MVGKILWRAVSRAWDGERSDINNPFSSRSARRNEIDANHQYPRRFLVNPNVSKLPWADRRWKHCFQALAHVGTARRCGTIQL
jgi:hypothetical protein